MTPDISTDVESRGVVLVVDDTPASRYITSNWLRRHGYEVVEATTGAAALAALVAQHVDLVVLDVGLPDMSGFDICERIKSTPALGHPVIHLSATSVRGADRAHGLTRGADAYLVEPVEPDELIATVDAVLRYYRARANAEQLAERLGRLTAATLAMQGASTFDELSAAIAGGAAAVLACPAVAVVRTPSGRLRRAVVAATGAAPQLDFAPPDLLRDVMAAPEGIVHPPGSAVLESLLPPGPDTGTDDWHALVVRPQSSGPPVCLAVQVPLLRDEHVGLLVQLGNAAVLAADTRRLYAEEHSLALTLQRSFLPDHPPERPGFDTAVRYVPAADNAEIGGDFYEIVELDDDQLLIAIGDVAGHSIHAATVMVELRHALRAYAIEGHGPSAILDRLETLIQHYHPSEFTTLCVMLLDVAGNELLIANGGHLPPLLVEGGEGRYLDVSGPMLGLRRPHPPAARYALPPAWSIVLVTDGLIERPGVDLDDALEDLRVVAGADASSDELCTRLLEHFSTAGRDDIALLVIRRSAG
ncbi:SpoIIE family protein phosphatase [Pseudonocardia sp. GCM10023141]|uniref:SpoIIE family protein phosphatase n=1 Tax=Pseudonocardia sp. GCM10023141 TaxID=3252653 RepID=UPI003607C93B